jgi:hypothetical protein
MCDPSNKSFCASKEHHVADDGKNRLADAFEFVRRFRLLKLSGFVAAVAAALAISVMNPFASGQDGKRVAKEYVWELQYCH